jgi:hypothetical protein
LPPDVGYAAARTKVPTARRLHADLLATSTSFTYQALSCVTKLNARGQIKTSDDQRRNRRGVPRGRASPPSRSPIASNSSSARSERECRTAIEHAVRDPWVRAPSAGLSGVIHLPVPRSPRDTRLLERLKAYLR